MKTVLKVLTALAAVAGVVYVVANYGDKIVAWAKKLLAACPCCSGQCECEGACKCDGECKSTEEAPAEEAAVEEAPAEEAPVEEIVIEAGDPVADEDDFAE